MTALVGAVHRSTSVSFYRRETRTHWLRRRHCPSRGGHQLPPARLLGQDWFGSSLREASQREGIASCLRIRGFGGASRHCEASSTRRIPPRRREGGSPSTPELREPRATTRAVGTRRRRKENSRPNERQQTPRRRHGRRPAGVDLRRSTHSGHAPRQSHGARNPEETEGQRIWANLHRRVDFRSRCGRLHD